MSKTLFPALENTATFSPCGRYRWHLSRTWDTSRPMLVFLMLNPSTADAVDNDPTVTRCIARARRLGYGGIVVLNIFAWRSTDPANLPPTEALAVGDENDGWILRETACRTVVCAWGIHGEKFGRGHAVANLLANLGRPLLCLGVTESGQPRHPLYIPADRELIAFAPPAGPVGDV